jgi:hypothetical protein
VLNFPPRFLRQRTLELVGAVATILSASEGIEGIHVEAQCWEGRFLSPHPGSIGPVISDSVAYARFKGSYFYFQLIHGPRRGEWRGVNAATYCSPRLRAAVFELDHCTLHAIL